MLFLRLHLQPLEALSYYESNDSGNDDFFHASRCRLGPVINSRFCTMSNSSTIMKVDYIKYYRLK